MKDVVIVSACRTAIGTFGGSLKNMNGAHIGAVAMKGAVERAGIDPAMIDDVRFGCCLEPVDALNVSRVSALLAGIPDSVAAATINRSAQLHGPLSQCRHPFRIHPAAGQGDDRRPSQAG